MEKTIMKAPDNYPSKWSLPGKLAVLQRDNYMPVTYPRKEAEERMRTVPGTYKNLMVTVYDHGKVNTKYMEETFDDIRKRVETQWKCLTNNGRSHKGRFGISASLILDQASAAKKIHKWPSKDALKNALPLFRASGYEPDSMEMLNEKCKNLFGITGIFGENGVIKRDVDASLKSEFHEPNTYDRELSSGSVLRELDRLLDNAVSRL
jgi:hypothetical protein